MKKLIAVFLCIMLVTGCSYAFAGDAWVCPQSGAENGENFCVKCGTPKPEMLVCPACGEQYPPDSGVVFCGKCGTKILQNDLSSGKLEGPGFDTPEEALACYMEGLKNLDFEQMLSAFAWETQAEHYSIDMFFNRVKPHTTKDACFRGFSPRTSFPPYSGNSALGSLRCQGRIQANERG